MSIRQSILLALIALAPVAAAQDYPSRPIRFIIPYPPGGGTDTVARLLNPHLIERLGQQIVIDNRGGANAIVGTDIAAKATPDGYTMLFCLPANLVINPAYYAKLPYEPSRDFTSVIHLDNLAFMLTVNPSLPVKTVADLINLARAKPGQLNFGSSGLGSSPQMASELIKVMAKVNMVHVPFRGGGPALAALMAGEVQFWVGTVISQLPHVKSGRLRAVAVTTKNRLASLPDLPTIGETLPGYESVIWHGVVVPKGTPAAIVRQLNAAFNSVLRLPEIAKRLRNSGVEPVGGTPEEFAALIKSETVTYAKLLKEIGMAGTAR